MSLGSGHDVVPWPLAALLGRLPQWPPSAAMALALNLGVAERLDQAALAALVNKVVRIRVRDAGICVTLCFDGRRFTPRAASAPADVTITAAARDFALLAARKEDPDTLFFARRLSIDGDTEAGLIVKNMLDAVDLTPLVSRMQWPIAIFEHLRALAPFGRPRTREAPPQRSPGGSVSTPPSAARPPGVSTRATGTSHEIVQARRGTNRIT